MNNQDSNEKMPIFNSSLDNNNQGINNVQNHNSTITSNQTDVVNGSSHQNINDFLMRPMNETNQIKDVQNDSLVQPLNDESVNKNGNLEGNSVMQQPIISVSRNNSYLDEDLLRAFVGDNFEKVTSKRFNFAAFFFTSIYFLYRKMYVLGIVIAIISATLTYFLKATMIISLVVGIISGFIFNYLYLDFARKKIENIKRNETNEDIKMMCIKKGGTSIVLAVLVFGIYVFLFSMFNLLFSGANSASNADGNAISLEVDTTIYMGDCNDGNAVCTVHYPYSSDGKDISCTLDNKNSKWHLTQGYDLSLDSPTCEDFMSAVYEYSSLSLEDMPDKGEIIISSDGLIKGNGTKFIYGNKTCVYSFERGEFKCN